MRNSKSILLIEDDQVDAMTVKRALKDLRLPHELIHSENGEAALVYLRAETSKHPGVILVDLNMPKMNGIEFLRNIKTDPELKKIPVVVLTTSRNERDVIESFEFSVAGYMVKPADYKKFMEAIKVIHDYWALSLLPGQN
jgi:CheY-like chemotaxis protein